MVKPLSAHFKPVWAEFRLERADYRADYRGDYRADYRGAADNRG